ncbi:MAG: single-stranded-DNA-specific exonuclease RecJ, partial [bacterium]
MILKSSKVKKAKKVKKYEVREWSGETILDHLLNSRGVLPEEKEAFLNPEYDKHVYNPFLMMDMEKAVIKILSAIENNEKIVIYGDFDADGIPASVVLHDFFKKVGYHNFVNYIPHRHREGFGFHKHVIEGLAEENKADINHNGMLVITVDCGITDVDTVKLASELGIDVIITDHHLPDKELPSACAVVDPKRMDCAYPDKMLCGAGVAFKLVQALISYDRSHGNKFDIKEGWEKWLLDMVGIATLSDMVPLVNENRVFAKYGLMVLRKTPRLGLVKLFRALKVSQKDLVEEDITFLITPRINAASRMADPRDAFLLLSTTDSTEAESMVKHLNTINDERKVVVAKMSKEIHKVVREQNLDNDEILVVGNPDWSPTLLGLVSTTLVKDYGVPVFLWGRSEGVIKGSCRSDGVCDVVAIMRDIQEKHPDVFLNAGGHSFAGGYSVNDQFIHEFRDKIKESYSRLFIPSAGFDGSDLGVVAEKTISYLADAILLPEQVNWKTWGEIEKMMPYGEGNAKPLFVFKDVKIDSIKMFGKQKEHLEIGFDGLKAIQFFAEADIYEEIESELGKGNIVRKTVLGNLEKSTFTYSPVL